MGDELARRRQLRDGFQLAKAKLEAISETGLSDDGQPLIRETAEALKSFAAWFSELTLEDMSLFGSAYRVHDALVGLDAIVDWVGLHWSQQFAQTIGEHAAELAEKAEALDAAISKAFTVKRTPSMEVRSKNRRVSAAQRDAIEDGIEAVASLAGHLGIRLQRTAGMVGSRHIKPGYNKQKLRRDRKGAGGRTPKWSAKQKKQILDDRSAHERQMSRTKKAPLKVSLWRRDWASDHNMTVEEARKLWQAAKRAKYR